MSKIQTIQSTPEYISKFINFNLTKLIEIYEQGLKEHNNIGCLGLTCSEETNKMDVFFMNEIMVLKELSKESWEQLKSTINDKKLFIVKDIDKNCIFLIYI